MSHTIEEENYNVTANFSWYSRCIKGHFRRRWITSGNWMFTDWFV